MEFDALEVGETTKEADLWEPTLLSDMLFPGDIFLCGLDISCGRTICGVEGVAELLLLPWLDGVGTLKLFKFEQYCLFPIAGLIMPRLGPLEDIDGPEEYAELDAICPPVPIVTQVAIPRWGEATGS